MKKKYQHPVVTEETAIAMAKGFAKALEVLVEMRREKSRCFTRLRR